MWKLFSLDNYYYFHCEAPNFRMEPVTALGILSLVLNIMCAALNLVRGIHLAEHSLQVTFSLQFKRKDTWWKDLMVRHSPCLVSTKQSMVTSLVM